MSGPRGVLDTNCLVSALIFSRGNFAWLREAWQTGRFTPLVSRDTVGELLRVLAYPKFELTGAEQEALLAEFLPYAETVRTDAPAKASIAPKGLDLPSIRDANDLIFLELAALGEAAVLVSGDRDILALKGQFRIPILTITEFAEWLPGNPG